MPPGIPKLRARCSSHPGGTTIHVPGGRAFVLRSRLMPVLFGIEADLLVVRRTRTLSGRAAIGIDTGLVASTDRSDGPRICDFLELPGVHVVDESTQRDRIGPGCRDPGMVQDGGHRSPHVPR